MTRFLRHAAAAVALVALALPGAAHAAPSAEIDFSTVTPGAITSVNPRIDYESTDAAGNQRALRRHVLTFPAGTVFDPAAAGNCQASAEELHAEGLGACPADSKVGGGILNAIATKPPASSLGTVKADLTFFNASRPKDRPDAATALIVAVSLGGKVTTAFVIPVEGNVATEITPTVCATPGEQPPCPNGELTVRSVDYTIAQHTRTVNGRRHRLITTPRACPSDGRWRFHELMEYRDGTLAEVASSTPCLVTAAPPRLSLTAAPRKVTRCRATRFTFTAVASDGPVAGATVRFANRRAVTDGQGRAAIPARVCVPGRRRATVKLDGYRKGVATVAVVR